VAPTDSTILVLLVLLDRVITQKMGLRSIVGAMNRRRIDPGRINTRLMRVDVAGRSGIGNHLILLDAVCRAGALLVLHNPVIVNKSNYHPNIL